MEPHVKILKEYFSRKIMKYLEYLDYLVTNGEIDADVYLVGAQKSKKKSI